MYIVDDNFEQLKKFEGYGKQDKRPGAGHVTINVTELRIFESKISSSYLEDDYKNELIIPGTAGYVFIKANEIQFEYDDKNNNSSIITKGACLIQN